MTRFLLVDVPGVTGRTSPRVCCEYRGFDDVSDVLGGFGAWERASLPAACGDGAESADDTPQIGPRSAVQ